MGWSEGSTIVYNVAMDVVQLGLSDDQKFLILNNLVKYVLRNDCDTIDECRGIDKVLDRIIDAQWGPEDNGD